MIYAVPVVGWIIGIVLHTCLAVPFYLAWNYVAPIYFVRWIPVEFIQLPFWDIVALFITISIVKLVLLPKTRNYTNVETKDKK